MNGTGYPVVGMGPKELSGWFAFDPNGTSTISTSTFRGSLKRYVSSVTYGSTGTYTIVFTSDFNLPARLEVLVSANFATQALAFGVGVLTKYVASTRTIVLGAYIPDGSSSVFKAVAPAVGSAVGDVSIIMRICANDSAGL